MEYQVPQFIEVEDKIFGPFTLKQFIFIAGGAGLCVILILYVHPLFLGIILSVPAIALTAALAFYRVNNKSFLELVEAGFNFYLGNRLYLWKKDKPQAAAPAAPPVAPVTRTQLGLSSGKLKELAWSLDIKEDVSASPPTYGER